MPVQLVSDKYLKAERRNRLEKTRLDVACKHYDRETTKLNFEIDREKRIIRKAFRNVVKTSGASEAGVPPKNETDNDHEKCPSYRQGLRLSNKRLMEWRECEKQLEKFIQNHESEMDKPRKNRPISAKSTKSERKSTINGFDQETYNDDVFFDEDDAVSTVTSVNPMDVLKEDSEQNNEEFNVKDWEKSIIESYKKMVSSTVSSSCSGKTDNSINKLRSKSSPAIITTTTELNTGQQRRRPHTAQARRRPPSGRSLPQRPASAQVIRNKENESKQFLITKDSIFIRTGQKYEKLIDNRPVEKPVLVNNYLDTPTPGNSNLLNSSLGSVNSLCPVQEGDEEGQNEDEIDIGDVDKTKDDKQFHESEDRQPNHKLLKKAVQKWRRRQSERLSSSDSKSRASLLHSNSDLSSYVESIRRLRHDSTFKQSNSEISTQLESGRRTRHDSESVSSRISLSSLLPTANIGIPADIEDFSHEQDKIVSKVTAERPVAVNKLVAVTSVVKAAMKFSRTARKRLLENMVEENSADPHEIVRQERLRRLQSRQHVLNSIATQWSDTSATIIEAVE